MISPALSFLFFFFNDTATTEIYTLSLHDALPIVRVGEKATVRATAFESAATGEVSYVGALIGQDTRTAPARITLPNPDGAWRPGLFVNVEVTASSQEAALTVVSTAIQRIENQKTVVFVPVQGGFRAQDRKSVV